MASEGTVRHPAWIEFSNLRRFLLEERARGSLGLFHPDRDEQGNGGGKRHLAQEDGNREFVAAIEHIRPGDASAPNESGTEEGGKADTGNPGNESDAPRATTEPGGDEEDRAAGGPAHDRGFALVGESRGGPSEEASNEEKDAENCEYLGGLRHDCSRIRDHCARTQHRANPVRPRAQTRSPVNCWT